MPRHCASRYLWILARQKHLDAAVQTDLLAKAKGRGFRAEDLIFVVQWVALRQLELRP
jgi:lipocalin